MSISNNTYFTEARSAAILAAQVALRAPQIAIGESIGLQFWGAAGAQKYRYSSSSAAPNVALRSEIRWVIFIYVLVHL